MKKTISMFLTLLALVSPQAVKADTTTQKIVIEAPRLAISISQTEFTSSVVFKTNSNMQASSNFYLNNTGNVDATLTAFVGAPQLEDSTGTKTIEVVPSSFTFTGPNQFKLSTTVAGSPTVGLTDEDTLVKDTIVPNASIQVNQTLTLSKGTQAGTYSVPVCWIITAK